jgi:hypothetical protein
VLNFYIFIHFMLIQYSVISHDRVHVEFFVMLKCRDASKYQTFFIPILLRSSSIVNVTQSYIATASDTDEIHRMHRYDECLGNKQQVCVQDVFKQNKMLHFLQYQSKSIDLIPNNGEQCAREIFNNQTQ